MLQAILGFIFLLLLGGFGVFQIIDLIRFNRKALSTEGVIVSLAPKAGTDAGPAYYPVVQFLPLEAGSEEEVTFQSPFAYTRPPKYRIGDRVPVLYDPTNPPNAQIKSWERWLLPSVLTAVGVVVCVGMGLIFLFAS